MRFPIDTSGLAFMAASGARPVTDFETKQQRVDVNGELLFNLQVVALDADGAQILTVRVVGDPGVGQGAMLLLEGLVAMPWTMGDRSGVSFRAERVKSTGVAPGMASGPRAVEKPEKAAA